VTCFDSDSPKGCAEAAELRFMGKGRTVRGGLMAEKPREVQDAGLSDAPAKTRLYHYTAPTTTHLGSILAEGQIKTTESNLSFTKPHAGPDVVWLTDSEDPAEQEWTTDVSPAKRLAVLGVELDHERATPWPAWARENGIEDGVFEGLAATGGDPDSWWVTTTPIQKWDIVSLTIAPQVVDGEPLSFGSSWGQNCRGSFVALVPAGLFGSRKQSGGRSMPAPLVKIKTPGAGCWVRL
jgi:hypothetical protein